MGKTLAVACMLLAACAMYDKKADRLRDPERRPPPKDPVVVVETPYVDECTVDFHGPPTTTRKTKVAEKLVVDGDTSSAQPAKTDVMKVELAKISIEKYIEALRADPYSAEATLKLALAYDKVLRKGCAIAMLKRLSQLAENPKFKADLTIGRVLDNEQWFKPYRQAALRAVGH